MNPTLITSFICAASLGIAMAVLICNATHILKTPAHRWAVILLFTLVSMLTLGFPYFNNIIIQPTGWVLAGMLRDCTPDLAGATVMLVIGLSYMLTLTAVTWKAQGFRKFRASFVTLSVLYLVWTATAVIMLVPQIATAIQ